MSFGYNTHGGIGSVSSGGNVTIDVRTKSGILLESHSVDRSQAMAVKQRLVSKIPNLQSQYHVDSVEIHQIEPING